MNRYINKEGKNNIMSYMITYITKYGVVIASDSYSCYNDRALKDANYQKVHCIKENELYIGSTGLNVLIDENKQLIDINDTYKKFFANINDLNVEETIDKYIQLIQMSCDHFTQDVRLIIAYKYNTYIVDIQHMKRPKVEKKERGTVDIICSGDSLVAMNGLIQFRNKTLDITLEEAIKACKESVEYAILVEKSLHLEGERTIGGDIQWVVLDYDKVKE